MLMRVKVTGAIVIKSKIRLERNRRKYGAPKRLQIRSQWRAVRQAVRQFSVTTTC